MSLRLVLLLTLPLLCACAAGPNTPSGRPEVAIVASKTTVRDALIVEFASRGFGVDRSDESSIVLSKASDSVATNMLLGSMMSPTVYWRALLTLAEAAGEVHVFGRIELVQNKGTAFEGTTDCSRDKAGAQVQGMFERVKAAVGQPVGAKQPEAEAEAEPDRAPTPRRRGAS